MTAALLAWTLKASLILLGAFAVTALMRHASAAARHFVWTLALAGVLLLPALGLVVPAWRVSGIPALLVTSAAPANAPAASGPSGGVSGQTAPTGPAPVRFEARQRRADPVAVPSARYDLTPALSKIDWLPLLPLLWLVGAGLVLLRLAAGLVSLWWIGRRAVMVTDARWLHAAHAIARRLGMGRGVTLLLGDSGTVPMTWGVLQPVVWLPADAEEWDEERRALVLTHELAHVRRRDALTQWIAHLALVVNWFNPLAWVAVKRFRDERERACDDAVLELGARPTIYADHLLDIVRSHGVANGPMPALAMARRSQFEGRLLAILDGASPRRGLTARSAFPVGLLALAAVLPIAAISSEPPGPQSLIADVPLLDSAFVSAEREQVRPATRDSASPSPQAGPATRPLRTRLSDSTLRLVIAAAASMTNDGDKSDILRSVLRHPRLDAGDVTAVLEATRGMTSDGSRRDVLIAAIPRVDFGRRPSRVAFFGSVAKFTSDGDRKDVLLAAFSAVPIRDAAIRRDFVAAVRPMTSDGDRADVLMTLLSRTRLDPAAVRDVIESTGSMTSDGDKSRVLVTLARTQKLDAAAHRAYTRQVETMSSDGDRRVSLAALLPGGEVSVAGQGSGQGRGAATAQQGAARAATTARTEVVNGSRAWSTELHLDGSEHGRPSYSVSVTARGARVTPDGRRFAGLDRGGSLAIEETLFPGGGDSTVSARTTRTLQLRTSGSAGELVADYRVNGERREWNADAEAWLDRFVARWAGGHSR